MHQSHAFNDERFRAKTWGMFVHAAPFLLVLVLVLLGVGLGVVLRRLRQTHRVIGAPEGSNVTRATRAQAWLRATWLGVRAVRGTIYWGVFAAAGLLVSALGYSTQYAEPNAFIPGICFGAGVLGRRVARLGSAPGRLAGVLGLRRMLEAIGLGLISLQLVFALAGRAAVPADPVAWARGRARRQLRLAGSLADGAAARAAGPGQARCAPSSKPSIRARASCSRCTDRGGRSSPAARATSGPWASTTCPNPIAPSCRPRSSVGSRPVSSRRCGSKAACRAGWPASCAIGPSPSAGSATPGSDRSAGGCPRPAWSRRGPVSSCC